MLSQHMNPQLELQHELGLGMKPCSFCGSTDMRLCKRAWMHCGRPVDPENRVRVAFTRQAVLWRWDWLQTQHDENT